ncbi:30S ribosomal protein S6--L-glutamate ligase [Phaeodactylibacter sp.]|jgi:ribosomal protein S6--L-glutamate ligase|uniref:30S ribosomal protein S6--L-glutamate ligase n=1 Tax=Phaeodactylibacter sp. TaxID=1940289 RepID=UPI002600CD5E|nr:30S ribosomal protein S6--L-glutamate ligase [Phaeodactylibacter sp.]MCI4648214.1 30S ribosomal protein S6--L-glutamate ligase [Phaeodactylibacter sp.]MCI5091931.1 30S ribosomal protein S6--L-glutamate ligase [Phaeodactylibacter sp.]
MKIAILSRGPQLYSTQSLIRAGIKRGHEMHVVDHTRCSLVLERDRPRILYQGYRLERFDAVIPRIGASVTSIGASVISQFENMNVFVAANAAALIEARDKLRCLHRLAQHGIQIPKTLFVASGQNMQAAVSQLGGLPVVVKLLEGTHGIGVILAETFRTVESTVEAFQRLNNRVMLQEFIREARGRDVRVLVVNNQVVAAMERQARPGEFRSNLHRGGSARQVKLTPEERELAVKVVQIMGLHVGGVDFLRSERGPLIMEVNASPGLEGIETVTGINVAGRIIQFIEETLAQSS